MTAAKTTLFNTVNINPLSLDKLIVSDNGKLVKPNNRLHRLELLLIKAIFHNEQYPSIHAKYRIICIQCEIGRIKADNLIKFAEQLERKKAEFHAFCVKNKIGQSR